MEDWSMKIGIIVHSQTGTTLAFGQKIAGKLQGNGHTVELMELKTDGPVQPRATNISFLNIPDARPFDSLLIGGPVWAFSASPVVLAAIKKLPGISGKKVMPFVTMGFPLTGMGGKKAIKQMSEALVGAGALVLPGKIVPKLLHNVSALMEKESLAITDHFA
jgi:NAD(P)H dehydrogenase (quinone)